MNPRAAVAFADYIGMGPKRSLEKLCDRYRSVAETSPTRRLPTLKEWSSRYQWQDRISQAVTEMVDTRLEQAAEIDAGSFLKTSELIAERLEYTTRHDLDAVVTMRQAVRKPTAKTTTVTVTVEIKQRAEQIAAKYGVPVEDVIAEAEAIAAGAWDSWSPQP